MLVFSSALSTYSSVHSGWPCQRLGRAFALFRGTDEAVLILLELFVGAPGAHADRSGGLQRWRDPELLGQAEGIQGQPLLDDAAVENSRQLEGR